jgi:sensor histidine kinase YesM
MFGHRFRYIFILLLAIYSFFNILFTGGDSFFIFLKNQYYLFAIILLMVLLIWESNRLLFRLLLRNEDKFKRKYNILILFFLSSLIHVMIISATAAYLLPGWLGLEVAQGSSQFRLGLAFSFRINLFLHTIHAIMYYNSKLKNSMLEAEKLKTLTAESHFEALRDQVKPHFLFNSFNVLSGLVHKDPELASEFIQQLSRVYRYLLYHQQEKLASLATEMEFLDSYVFLLNIRFGEALKISTEVSTEKQEKYQIPPASVQLLVENAVKHNTVSRKNHLHINIFEENGFLVVRNNLQRKIRQETSRGLGLQNISLRYRHLSGKDIIVEDGHQFFTVRLPLMLPSDYESSHR